MVIASAKLRYRGLSVSTVVQACGSGNFGLYLTGIATRWITSVGPPYLGPGLVSLGPPKGGQGPSPFSAAALQGIGRALDSGEGTLTGALAQAEPTIAQDTPALAAQQEAAANDSVLVAKDDHIHRQSRCGFVPRRNSDSERRQLRWP